MQKNLNNRQPPGEFDPHTLASLCTNLAMIGADDARVRAVAKEHFCAHRLREDHAAALQVINNQRAILIERIETSRQAERELDPLVTVASNEEVCRPHWIKRVAGTVMGVVGIGMLMPIPIVVASGMAESDAISMVFDQPLLGVLYGIGPVGGAISIHALREAFESRSARKLFDLVLYSTAIAATGTWAMLFGPTFLEDAASGFGAAAESQASLSRFYTAQLLLEFTTGATCIAAAMSTLGAASNPVSKPNPERVAMSDLIDGDLSQAQKLANQADEIASNDENYETACRDFQERCVVHVEAAAKLLATHAAADAKTAISVVRETLINSIKTGDNDA